jgi:Kelch motif protein
MRGWLLIPIALIVAVLVALPVAAFTDSGLEEDVKDAVGFDTGECEPATNLASPWTEGPGLPYERDEPRAGVIDGKAYLVGGTTGVEGEVANGAHVLDPTDDLTRFDPRSGRYEDLAPLPQPLNHLGVAVYRGNLYVLGGYGRRTDTNTSKRFYRYDPRTGSWSRLPDMPQPRAAAAVGTIGHRLILAGGARDSKARSEAFSFDFRSGRWSRLPDMPSRREHVGNAVVGGKLYVLGGRTPGSLAVATAERYDPRRRRWEELAPMPVPVGGLEAVAADGEAVAIGGGNDEAGTVSGAVQAFDPASGEWTRWPDLRTPRHGHGVGLIGEDLWVFGGSACAYFNATDRVEWLPVADARRAAAD